MIFRKTSIFPAKRDEVFSLLQRLGTLQYVAAPYATFTPLEKNERFTWNAGTTTDYYFKLFGIISFGVHSIRIESLNQNGIQSREHNKFVPVWDHLITLKDCCDKTEYTDEVEIHAGWKTIFIWIWANAFYSHRQRKWIKLLNSSKMKFSRK